MILTGHHEMLKEEKKVSHLAKGKGGLERGHQHVFPHKFKRVESFRFDLMTTIENG